MQVAQMKLFCIGHMQSNSNKVSPDVKARVDRVPQDLEKGGIALNEVHAFEHLGDHYHHHYFSSAKRCNIHLLEFLGKVLDDFVLFLPLCWVQENVKLWIFYEAFSTGPHNQYSTQNKLCV